MTILTRENGDQVLGANKGEIEIAEVALDPSCPLVGMRISDHTLKIRKAYGARLLGIRPIDLSVSLKGALTVNFDRKKVKSAVNRYFADELAGKKYAIGDTLILSVREGSYEANRVNTEFFGVKLLRAATRVGAKEDKTLAVEMKRKQTLTLLILFIMVLFVSTSLLRVPRSNRTVTTSLHLGFGMKAIRLTATGEKPGTKKRVSTRTGQLEPLFQNPRDEIRSNLGEVDGRSGEVFFLCLSRLLITVSQS